MLGLMNESETDRNGDVCEHCGKNRGFISIITISEITGSPRQERLCHRCLQEQFGEGTDERLSAEDVISGPASHPEPDEESHRLIQMAGQIATANDSPVCDALHLLAALLLDEDGMSALEMHDIGDDAHQQLEEWFSEVLDLDRHLADDQLPTDMMTPVLQEVMLLSRQCAAHEHRRAIEPRHLVHGLLSQRTSPAAQLLVEAGAATREAVPDDVTDASPDTPMLNRFGRDLTAEAADGMIDPVIGRKEEIAQTIEILARRVKNNAVLVGDPGVGKTAIVEGLAVKMVNEEVPALLQGARLVSLDLAGMVAGTKYRGEFEQRLKQIMQEITASERKILLFVDELHTLLGAGAAEGAMDAANILKPLLARGGLSMIGATTSDEYHHRIKKDDALSRRFSMVEIDEPDVAETIEILRGLQDRYQAHHKVLFSDDAIIAAATLSHRYINEQVLPDKAIDLLDQAGARVRIRVTAPADVLAGLEEKAVRLRQEKDLAVSKEDYQRAELLKKEYVQVQQQVQSLISDPAYLVDQAAVTVQDITDIVSTKTGIPLGELVEGEAQRLQGMEDHIHKRVIGQERAVSAVSDAIRRARIGLAGTGRPSGSFLFLGPTGVGKTELAKAIAECLFATDRSLLRIDMSEYMEAHTISRLIGSSPGYVGYGEGGQLTEAVRRRPYSVVLLDEIEKAHKGIWNLLLQVLDGGHLTDSEGRRVDFRDTVIIMTSNQGDATRNPVGFAADQQVDDALLHQAREMFPQELLNRIDETVIFQPLATRQVAGICDLFIADLTARLSAEKEIDLEVTDQLRDHLAETGFDPESGARLLQGHIRRVLEKPLVDLLISNALPPGSSVTAGIKDGQITLR